MPDQPHIERGDVVWAAMDPVEGREQRGHRPHLVLSDERFHRARELVIAVPMTSKHRPWPTRIEIAPGSYAMAEQPRTFSVDRVTKVQPYGYDTERVVRIINRLI